MTDPSFNIKFDAGKGAPVGPKKTGTGEKDFKKIFDKGESDENPDPEPKAAVKDKTEGKESYENVELKLEAYDAKPRKTGVSLFELAASSETQEEEPIAGAQEMDEELPVAEISEEVKENSLSALFKGYGAKEKLNLFQSQASQMPQEEPEMDKLRPLYKALDIESPIAEEKAKFNVHFAQELPDLASINPMAPPIPQGSDQQTPVNLPPAVRAQELQEMIDQIVSKIYTVKLDGRTDTVITLKHPPLFADAAVVISSFDAAKGEFNIGFENLSEAAKRIIDMQESQNSLRFALEQRGYAVHLITATTQSEVLQIVEGGRSEEKSGNREGSSQGKKEKEKKETES